MLALWKRWQSMTSEILSLKTIINKLDLWKKSVETFGKKDLLLLATKLIEKIADISYAKKYYNSYLKKKDIKLVKRSKKITQQLKAIKNRNFFDIKSVAIDHPKNSNKLSETIILKRFQK